MSVQFEVCQWACSFNFRDSLCSQFEICQFCCDHGCGLIAPSQYLFWLLMAAMVSLLVACVCLRDLGKQVHFDGYVADSIIVRILKMWSFSIFSVLLVHLCLNSLWHQPFYHWTPFSKGFWLINSWLGPCNVSLSWVGFEYRRCNHIQVQIKGHMNDVTKYLVGLFES